MKRRTQSPLRIFLAFVIGCGFLGSVHPAAAKRALPKVVNPVTARGVTYSAPPDAMGFVVATDARNQRELWRKRIYKVKINRSRERDVQDVFITSLAVRDNALLVANERGEHFSLNLSNHKVARKSAD